MNNIKIRAKAPLRIGIAGGGTDVDPYASEKGGIVLNTTIDKYAYCTIIPNGTDKMSVRSVDYGAYEVPLNNGPLLYDGNMDLIKAVTNHFNITEGFDIYIRSDAPPGSGLGGSSAVIVSILSAMTNWIGEKLTKKEMALLACILEREKIGLKGGKQDQYASVFGGFNIMEFGNGSVKVSPVNVTKKTMKELQRCSVLCYTGKSRESAKIIDSQIQKFKEGVNENALDESKTLAVKIRDSLSQGEIHRMGELLGEAWEQKKKFTAMVTNPTIDDLYSTAMDSGAVGGKISGAGGGGFMFFICDKGKKKKVSKALQKKGAQIVDFTFESKGCKTWRCKE